MASVTQEVPLSGDWDGNGSDTIGVFRAGTWYLRNSNSSGGIDVSFSWGSMFDVPVAGDWDGDGIDTIGVFRNGTFYLRNSNSSGGIDVIVETGLPGGVPLVGDWDGDGITTVGLWESGAPNYGTPTAPGQYPWIDPLFSQWDSPAPSEVRRTFTWGVLTDVPVAGDWDGDGTTTIGVYRAGTWFLRNVNSGGGVDLSFPWGSAGDVPVVGDWNADGVSTIGVRRGDTFFQRNTNDSGGVSAVIKWGLPTMVEPRLPGATSTFYTNAAVYPRDSMGYPIVPYSRLTAVTMAHNVGFDRIVFRFASGLPLYRIRMQPPTSFLNPSDLPVAVPGGAALRLVFFGGGEWFQPPPFLPKTITGTTTTMTEAKNIGDFEAVNIWLVGIDRARAFRVLELTGPTRIVVDVQTNDFG